MQRSEQMLQMQTQIVGADDRNNYNEIQMNICSVLTVSRILCHRKLQSLTICAEYCAPYGQDDSSSFRPDDVAFVTNYPNRSEAIASAGRCVLVCRRHDLESVLA